MAFCRSVLTSWITLLWYLSASSSDSVSGELLFNMCSNLQHIKHVKTIEAIKTYWIYKPPSPPPPFAHHSAQPCVTVYSKLWSTSILEPSGSGNQEYILAGKRSMSSGTFKEDMDDNTLRCWIKWNVITALIVSLEDYENCDSELP